jgi:hypothetical protein
MSKIKIKGDNLPPLQRAIVHYFAKNEPKTINETVTALKKSYKPTWTAFESLQKKRMIIKTTSKSYRGQEYPRFWLTDKGIITALEDGAKTNIIDEIIQEIYPDAEVAHLFLEIVPFFDPEVIGIAKAYARGEENLDFAQVAQVILSGAVSGMEVEDAKKVSLILKKYPMHYFAFKMIIEQMIKQLKYLIED